MKITLGVILFVVGVVNGVVVTGVAGSGVLANLYGVSFTDPDLVVLMRHRAVLFGLLGAALVAAAFLPSLRTAAIIGGLVSQVAFIVLALLADINSKIRSTMLLDIALTVALLAGLALHLVTREH